MSEEIQQNNQEYGADQIQILEGLEAVRKRPGMYIGSTSSRGLHHLVYEIVDNAVDEALAGYCKNIEITIEEDNSITVVDDGRGIPVGTNHKAGKSALEVVFTVLHAGGKFGGGGYKVSGGLHGVGASVVNALSTWLTVEVYKDGKIYGQSYKRGKADDAVKVIGECDENLHGPGKPLEDVFEAGVECSSKTMYPDWLSLTGKGYVASMYKQYGKIVSPMGCRAFLSPWYERGGMHPADDKDSPIFVGRFNIGAVSLHLPMILAKARQESRDFYEVLDYYLNVKEASLVDI